MDPEQRDISVRKRESPAQHVPYHERESGWKGEGGKRVYEIQAGDFHASRGEEVPRKEGRVLDRRRVHPRAEVDRAMVADRFMAS